MKNQTQSSQALAVASSKTVASKDIFAVEFAWLNAIICGQLFSVFPNLQRSVTPSEKLDALTPPDLSAFKAHPYAQLVAALSREERLLVALCVAAEASPQVLDPLLDAKRQLVGTALLGGIQDKYTKLLTPTLQTALFLLRGNATSKEFDYFMLFRPEGRLFKAGILESLPQGRIDINAPLRLTLPYNILLFTGTAYAPQYSEQFPASVLQTTYQWDDLVLAPKVMTAIQKMRRWIAHRHQIMQQPAARHFKQGYRAVFSGKSGTGKTLTATLLGKEAGLPVYRVDISSLVSKYIGETEKNLERLFQAAQHQDWLLFFDEAESLFAKRTAVQRASDQYANQTTGYLLQRIEDFDGTIIIATNKPTNMDSAFIRRFQSVIEFPMPSEAERLRLWEKLFSSEELPLEASVALAPLAKTYDHVTGGMLINILRSCQIMLTEADRKQLSQTDIIAALKEEYDKHHHMWKAPKN
ncbi:MAG: ATP-binding protein [Bacteroidota bacterium]